MAVVGAREHPCNILRRLKILEEHIWASFPAGDVAVRIVRMLALVHAALLTDVVGDGGLRRSLLGVEQIGKLPVEAGAAPVALGDGGAHLVKGRHGRVG